MASPRHVASDDRMKESTDSWEVLSVPSASGIEGQDGNPVTVSQFIPAKTRKDVTLERLLSDAQRESLQNSARQSLHQSKQSSPVFPESPAESGDCYISYEEFSRQMLNASDADGSTDWFWDWTFTETGSKVYHRVRRIPRKSSSKRRFFGLLMLANFLALILGAGLGYYLGKKIAAEELLEMEKELAARAALSSWSFRFN